MLFTTMFPEPAAVDSVTVVFGECMVLLLAMRKLSRWPQSGVAAILGGSDFDDSLAGSTLGLLGDRGGRSAHPLQQSFVQLRLILTDARSVGDIDLLTILQPFLLVIELSATLGHVTALALDAITKFFDYHVIGPRLKNLQNSLVLIISSLTHCRFEAADQSLDDSVLLKVLRLLEYLVDLHLSRLLPNAVVTEVICTCLSLACNKRRSEVLRRAAEMAMVSMTIRVFRRLCELQPAPMDFQFTEATLPQDTIGGTHTPNESVGELAESPIKKGVEEPQFDIVCISEFFRLLISMIAPSNQYQHMESTRVFALLLINTAIEIAGHDISKHPLLMALVLDPVSKHVLLIITTADSQSLLLAALRLFCTMTAVMGRHLKSQIELTLKLLFRLIVPDTGEIQGNHTAVGTRIASSKETIVSALSLLWTRSPRFFARLFFEYDCDFERADLATTLSRFLCRLALPESALTTTDNVPPLCLEGILSLVAAIHDRTKAEPSVAVAMVHLLLIDKERKKLFIECTVAFNENPSRGILELAARQFIVDPQDEKEVANFLFHKSTLLNKRVLGEYLVKPKHKSLLHEFMKLFDFAGLRVDEALRQLLKAFRLPGESQQIERVVDCFAEHYVTTYQVEDESEHEPVVLTRDSVFVLSYSVIMLNTDMYNPQVKRQMDFDSYKRNLKGVNNKGDFPEWYLKKIYASLQDREIIMPEEHHGTEKWFDDVWHNLISSQLVQPENPVDIDDFDAFTLGQFDRVFFESIANDVIETLTKVYAEASDDNIITKLMSSIDKCVSVCIHFELHDAVDKLLTTLAEFSSLRDRQPRLVSQDENVRREIPITQISIEQREEPITISEMAVHFGRDFKAQLATVVLFRLVRKQDCKVTKSWDSVVKVILTLYENCLVDPNLFGDFQKKLMLPPLERVKPRYMINKTKSLKDSGILSTFSSFLKGYSDEPPEPSDLEIEATLSTVDFVKSVNIPGVFNVVSTFPVPHLTTFTNILLDNMPQPSADNQRFFESELLFLFEIEVCFSLLVDSAEVTHSILEKLNHYLSLTLSKSTRFRLAAYLMILVRHTGSHKDEVLKVLKQLGDLEDQTFSEDCKPLTKTVISLADTESKLRELVKEEVFWRVLRVLSGDLEQAKEVFTFAESVVKNTPEDIVEANYVNVLALLDEISSLGAVGAQWEQLQGQDKANDANKEQLQATIELSKRSIALTSDLLGLHKKATYAMTQALAHQCFNPCREVRVFAIMVLQKVLLSSTTSEDFTAAGIFEFGLFPLLAELEKNDVVQTDARGFPETQSQVLTLVSKVFLRLHGELSEEDRNNVWMGIVNGFASFNKLNEQSNVNESTKEVMKNMILVLQTEFASEGADKLWDVTWAKLDKVYPGLKKELAGNEPAVLENVVATSAESIHAV